MARTKISDYVITLQDFSGGLNTFVNPIFLEKQVPDVENMLFDEPVGVARKVYGWKVINNNYLATNYIPVKALKYEKSTGDEYVVVCVYNMANRKYQVWYCTETSIWMRLGTIESKYPFDMAVFEDTLWVVNSVDVPAVWNGVEVKYLDGAGIDWDGNKLANFKLPLGRPSGNFVCVHQNRLVMANTVENGSEIIFSRFVDDDGNIVKATSEKAWVNTNQILVNPDDGESITAIYSYLGMLCVFKQNSMYIITGDLVNPSVIQIPSAKGCIDKNSIVEWNNLLVYVAYDGIYAFDGRSVRWLSQNIDNLIRSQNLSSYISPVLKSKKLSTYADFITHKEILENFCVLGTSANSLTSPKNFVLDNSESFYNHASYYENIMFVDGIQLEHQTSLGNWVVKKEGKIVEGSDENIYDNNYDSYVKCRSFSQSSLAFQITERAKITVEITFNNNIFIKGFNIKYHLITRTSGGNLNNGVAYITYKAGDWANAKVLESVSVNQATAPTTRYVEVNENTNYLKIVLFSTANAVSYPIPLYLDATAEIVLFEISLDYKNYRKPSGVYYTRWIDTEKLENFGFSVLNLTKIVPANTNINVYYAYSDDNTIPLTSNSITWYLIDNNQIPNITKRYYAFKVELNTASPLLSPVLKFLKQNFSNESVYRAKIQLSQPVYWQNFYASFNTNGGNIYFYVSLDGNMWYQVYNDSSLPFSSASSQIFVRVNAFRNGDTGTPQIFSIFLTYSFTQSISVVYPIDGVENENRCFFKFSNNLILVLNKTGVWSKINDAVDCFVKNSEKFEVIKYKRLTKYLDNSTTNLTSSITTKTVILGTPLESFLIRKIWVLFDKNVRTSNNSILEVYDGKSENPVAVFNISYDKDKNLTSPVEINCGIKCYQFFVKLKNNNTTEDVGLISLQFYIRPLRVLSQEE